MIPSRLWEYLIASFLIILAPGPSVLFTIARAIAWGRAAAIATVFGNASGMFLVSVAVAVGLGPLLQSSHLFYTGVQWAGGSYLIYLGYAAFAASKVDAQGMQKTDGAKPSLLTSVRNGFWVGVLNPKSIVFFAAILPAFVDQEKVMSDPNYCSLAQSLQLWHLSQMVVTEF